MAGLGFDIPGFAIAGSTGGSSGPSSLSASTNTPSTVVKGDNYNSGLVPSIILAVILVVAIVLVVIFWMTNMNQLSECETTQSPVCPPFTCLTQDADCGFRAFVTVNGKKICSGAKNTTLDGP